MFYFMSNLFETVTKTLLFLKDTSHPLLFNFNLPTCCDDTFCHSFLRDNFHYYQNATFTFHYFCHYIYVLFLVTYYHSTLRQNLYCFALIPSNQYKGRLPSSFYFFLTHSVLSPLAFLYLGNLDLGSNTNTHMMNENEIILCWWENWVIGHMGLMSNCIFWPIGYNAKIDHLMIVETGQTFWRNWRHCNSGLPHLTNITEEGFHKFSIIQNHESSWCKANVNSDASSILSLCLRKEIYQWVSIHYFQMKIPDQGRRFQSTS